MINKVKLIAKYLLLLTKIYIAIFFINILSNVYFAYWGKLFFVSILWIIDAPIIIFATIFGAKMPPSENFFINILFESTIILVYTILIKWFLKKEKKAR